MALGRRARDAETRTTTSDEAPGAQSGEQPAQAWEFDERDTWEPVVPDTWAVPAESETGEAAPDERQDAAGWTDAARSEAEWEDAGWDEVDWAEQARADEAQWDGGPTLTPSQARQAARAVSSPARMALGLADLAAQRMRGGVPAGDTFVTGVGLLQETANGLREIGHRLLGPASRAAGSAIRTAAVLPMTGAPIRAARRAGERLGAAVDQARDRGTRTIETSRAEAQALLRQGLTGSMAWAKEHALTPLADALAQALAPRLHPDGNQSTVERVSERSTDEVARRRR